MTRTVAVVGAPSNLGARPYDDGQPRALDYAPTVLRERGLVSRLGAVDLGDVVPPPYEDVVRPVDRPRNERGVGIYSNRLAERVAAAVRRHFVVVIGGDCSIALGCLRGVRRSMRGAIGLVYVDAHADFATADESSTGSMAGMSLSLALGRAQLRGFDRRPLVNGEHVALLGRRDAVENAADFDRASLLDVSNAELLAKSPDQVIDAVLTRVAADAVEGFWIQLDVDVINPVAMRAVESPSAGGLSPRQLVDLLTPIVQHPRALGLSITTYDPALDADRSAARQLARLIEVLVAAPRERV